MQLISIQQAIWILGAVLRQILYSPRPGVFRPRERSTRSMHRPASQPVLSLFRVCRSLLLAILVSATGETQARSQTSAQGGSVDAQREAAAALAARRRAAAAGAARGAAQPRQEPSQAYQESMRRTIEKQRERRANRRQGMSEPRQIGGIVPWPMPPALVIRHTPDVHDEIESLVGMLRR
jgi:hypothetical protein